MLPVGPGTRCNPALRVVEASLWAWLQPRVGRAYTVSRPTGAFTPIA